MVWLCGRQFVSGMETRSTLNPDRPFVPMKKLFTLTVLLLGGPTLCFAACPSRDNTYIAGTVIQPADVLANEDALFQGIQDGLESDCIADGAITTAKLADGAVTSAKIANNSITTDDLAFSITQGNILPAGAVFFMVTGNCPAWTSDVSTTYANLFVRINATQGTLAGSDTHTHTAGTYVGASHTHSIPYNGWTGENTSGARGEIVGWTTTTLASFTANQTSGSGGAGTISGTSASANNFPAHVTMKACQVS